MKPIDEMTPDAARDCAITNVTVVDPEANRAFPGHVVIKDGLIDLVAEGPAKDVNVPAYDGAGLHLGPGFVDIHVHLREPGFEYKETIRTGTMAAAAGGFTSIACMPNTKPAIDERSVVEFIIKQAKIAGFARVHPVAAATVGRKGETLSEYHELVDAGAIAVSDDGDPVPNAGMVRRVLEYAGHCDVPFAEHCEDMSASGYGVMNEGYYSTRFGLPGVPGYSEEVCLARDLLVLETVPSRYHASHISTRRSVELLREAKRRGLPVTAETAPHYICLEDKDLQSYNTSLKINPPLRGARDREAIIEGIKDGTLDCVASDHAPHAPQEKQVEFEYAPPGSIGLETTLGVVLTHLFHAGHLPLPQVLALITHKPADAMGLEAGRIKAGMPADLVLFDPDEEWVVDRALFHSKSKNSAFVGRTLRGRVKHTIFEGVNVTASLLGV
ncbi:MAG: dihydroorotase [Candidatus Latescibacterota bacterium]|jgi:dihydroorotase